MVAHVRRGDHTRESWIVTNLTKKILTIGDLGTVPELRANASLNLLNFASKDKIGHSKDLQRLVQYGWVSFKKTSEDIPSKNYIVDTAGMNNAATEVSVYEIEEGIVNGIGGSGASIGDLDDVDITGINEGEFLKWNDTLGVFIPVASSSTVNDIDDITNVDSSTVTDNQILVYDSLSGNWENKDQNLNETEKNNLELEGEYKLSSLNNFKELIYSGDNLTQINVWETPAKIVKIFEKNLSYTGGQLTQIVLTRVSDSEVLTKDFTYTGDNLTGIETTQS